MYQVAYLVQGQADTLALEVLAELEGGGEEVVGFAKLVVDKKYMCQPKEGRKV